jgi:hypothetical protein
MLTDQTMAYRFWRFGIVLVLLVLECIITPEAPQAALALSLIGLLVGVVYYVIMWRLIQEALKCWQLLHKRQPTKLSDASWWLLAVLFFLIVMAVTAWCCLNPELA